MSEGAKGLILHILAQEEVRMMENFFICLLSLITVLAEEFKTNQVQYMCILELTEEDMVLTDYTHYLG